MIHQGPRFFKFVLPFSQISKQLRIPPQFVKHIDKEAFERATLRGPSGYRWPVKLHKHKNGIFLIDGWSSFFEAHSLKNYEVLVFKYEGKMLFDVKIYGRNGLERGNVLKNGDSQSQDSICLRYDSGDEIKSENEEVYVAESLQKAKQIGEKRKRGIPRKDFLTDKTEHISERRKRDRPRKDSLSDKSSGLVTEESDECYRENKKFCSKFPFFEQHIDQKKLKRNDFYVPVCFYQKYLRIGEMKLILRNKEGKSWGVRVSPYRKAAYFRDGWIPFSNKNKLKIGDRCIFELVKKTEMQVHIFRSSTN